MEGDCKTDANHEHADRHPEAFFRLRQIVHHRIEHETACNPEYNGANQIDAGAGQCCANGCTAALGQDGGNAGSQSVERHGKCIVERHDGHNGGGQHPGRAVFPQHVDGRSRIGCRSNGPENDARRDRGNPVVAHEIDDERRKESHQQKGRKPLAKQNKRKLLPIFLEDAGAQLAANEETDQPQRKVVERLKRGDVGGMQQTEPGIPDQYAHDNIPHHLRHIELLEYPCADDSACDTDPEYRQYP
jgi:hypothetical protein